MTTLHQTSRWRGVLCMIASDIFIWKILSLPYLDRCCIPSGRAGAGALVISSTTYALEVVARRRTSPPWECLRRCVCLLCAWEAVWVPNGRPCCARPCSARTKAHTPRNLCIVPILLSFDSRTIVIWILQPKDKESLLFSLQHPYTALKTTGRLS